MFRLCALLFIFVFVLPFCVAAQTEKFDVVKVAEGVYATIRKDSPGLAAEANNVFIINENDVIVVDTNISQSSTKEVLAALKKLTNKPVRYVINTHWHDDHILGNQVYREAFPQAEFIAHANTLEYLPTTGLQNRKKALEGVPSFLEMLKDLLAKNKSLTGNALTDEERIAYGNDIKIGERFVTETPTAQIILPTITIYDKLVLHRGSRTIEIMQLGRGHTAGDIVVYLPKENILITGDLVVYPVPYVGSEQSHVTEWGATLEKLIALKPAVIIPGHGPVMRDDSYLRLIANMFNYIKQQTEAAVARGETLEQARKSVNLDEYRKQIAGESQFKKVLFANYVASPAIAAAYREASAKKQSDKK